MSWRLGVALAAGMAVCGVAAQPNGAPKTGPVSVQVAESGPQWASLTVAQQTALAPLKPYWSGIDAGRKAKWIVVAQRFPSMPAEERRRVQERMAAWAALAPSERGRARQNFQELRSLPSEDRQAMWEAYRALPEEQRQELAQRARTAAAPSAPASGGVGKRRVAVNPPTVTSKPVTPTLVQAKPGATTTLVTRTPNPPAHHQAGLPKIAASGGFVNPSTLLPSKGPQGAAAVTVVTAPAGASGPAGPASAADPGQ